MVDILDVQIEDNELTPEDLQEVEKVSEEWRQHENAELRRIAQENKLREALNE